MRIDRKASPWILFSVVIFAIATFFFVRYWHETQGQPTGGSWTGLTFGAAGSAAILVAMLLVVRKKLRAMRLGRSYYWMQAHVWFGLLSYPLILYHAGGFYWGGTLTQVLMWIFTVVYISGIIGLILQQIIPVRLVREVPAETIAAQVRHVLGMLREEADAAVQPLRAERKHDVPTSGAGAGGKGTVVATMEQASVDIKAFDAYYGQKIVPFLGDRFHRESPLAEVVSARDAFASWRDRLPENLRPMLATLESLVDERRQLARQRRLDSWLHGWLLIHVPLSYAMLVLGVIHAIMAFKFTSRGG